MRPPLRTRRFNRHYRSLTIFAPNAALRPAHIFYLKMVRYSALKENPIKILGVYDSYGNKLSFTVFPEYIRVCGGEITLIYAYSPANAGLDEETGYTEKDVSAEVLALGTAAEDCLIAGRTEEAVAFRKRFSDGVERFCMPENKRIKRRGWL